MLLAGILPSCQRPDPARGPNIVMIIIDTLRADRLGCYGYERHTSPEIDGYARQGVRFSRVVSQSSWTRPSIGSFLTSIHPRTIGIHHEQFGILDDRFMTLAELLQAGGYRTIGATANPHLNRSFNFHQGFDHYLDTVAVWPWMDSTGGQVPADVPRLPSAMDLFEKMENILDEETDRNRAAPHYLQVNIMEVHEDYGDHNLVREEYRGLFEDIRYERGRRYLQAIRQVSRDIDWFVRRLAARPGWEDAIFVFVSDHGEGLDTHPSVPLGLTHGYLLYESHIMVPWILYSPSETLPRGQVIDRPVRLLELMPTLLDIAGIPSPAGISGHSLLPLIQGDPVPLPENFVVETRFQGTDKMGVYTHRWKYFDNRDGHAGLNRRALHPIGVEEDGAGTDVLDLNPDVGRDLAEYLRSWEQENPRAPSTPGGRGLSDAELEQLRSLGYVD